LDREADAIEDMMPTNIPRHFVELDCRRHVVAIPSLL
jgi:hypothetical protein